MRLLRLGVLSRNLPFSTFQVHILPLRQQQLGLAHKREKNEMKRQLELASNVGPIERVKVNSDFIRCQDSRSSSDLRDKASGQCHCRIRLSNPTHHGIIEDALDQTSDLRSSGFFPIIAFAEN